MRMAEKDDLKPGTTLHRDGLQFHVQNEWDESTVQALVSKNDNPMGVELINKSNAHLYKVSDEQDKK